MGRLFDIHVQGLSEPFFVRADPQEEDLLDLRQRRLLVAWRRVRFKSQAMPFRREIGQTILDEIDANIAELTVRDDGDLIFTRFGRTLTAAYDRDMTGAMASAFPGPLAKSFLSIYRLAIKTRMPYATHYKPPAESRVDSWHHMILPLRGENRDVGAFMVCHVPIGR